MHDLGVKYLIRRTERVSNAASPRAVRSSRPFCALGWTGLPIIAFSDYLFVPKISI